MGRYVLKNEEGIKMRFVHITKLEEAIPALRCGGGHGDREALRNQINRLGYALKEDFQFDEDAFAGAVFSTVVKLLEKR